MPHAASIQMQVLGPITVAREGDPPTTSRVTQPRQLALLAFLLLERPRGLHSRDSLLALLWPEHDASRARQALRNALHGLRRVLGARVISSAGDHLVGVNHAHFLCDALTLESQVDVGVLPVAADTLHAEPFAGFHVSRAPAFNEWLAAQRARLLRLQTCVRETAAQNGRGASTARNTARAEKSHQSSPHDHDAYALYVRGNYMFLQAAHNGRLEDLDRSRECFEQALTVDPNYALAIAGLANYYAVAAARGVITPFREAFARTIELSQAALAIDATLAVPHVHFGVKALYLDDDVQTALNEFTLAATLDPQYPEGRRFRGVVLGLLGQRSRSLEELEVAARLEPGVPTFNSSLAAGLILAGDMARAESLLRETLHADPAYGAARERLLRLLESQERFDDAVSERLRAPAMRDAERFLVALRQDGADGYRRERALELRQLVILLEAKLLEGSEASAGDLFHPPELKLTLAYAELGEWRKARTWKLQACAQRPGLAPRFAAEPMLAPLYSPLTC